ncbi:hypothetical protein V5O48_008262 [Marasmius crinis-equi]|uniref:DUF6534 domain-containing protein n=1 Tax=Marasmius crinis-equi TaxID=585013 RepID=A0ABR3FEV9_9AGAR
MQGGLPLSSGSPSTTFYANRASEMTNYNDPIGSVLIATWVCSMLEMLIVSDTVYYYTHYPKDSFMLKLFIGIVVAVDFGSLIAGYGQVYLLGVTYWGQEIVLQEQFWPIPVALVTTGLTAFLVQSFLIYRVQVLYVYLPVSVLTCINPDASYGRTKNWLVPAVLAVGAIGSLTAAVASGATFAIYRPYADRYKGRIQVLAWLSTTTATDIAITLALIIRFIGMKTTFKQTETVIHRLIRTSMQTGATTCILAVIVLITYVVNNASNVEAAFTFILGRAYVLTLLYNVNLRTSQTTSAQVADSDTRRPTTISAPEALPFGGIEVHRTAHVHMDEEYKLDTKCTSGSSATTGLQTKVQTFNADP